MEKLTEFTEFTVRWKTLLWRTAPVGVLFGLHSPAWRDCEPFAHLILQKFPNTRLMAVVLQFDVFWPSADSVRKLTRHTNIQCKPTTLKHFVIRIQTASDFSPQHDLIILLGYLERLLPWFTMTRTRHTRLWCTMIPEHQQLKPFRFLTSNIEQV